VTLLVIARVLFIRRRHVQLMGWLPLNSIIVRSTVLTTAQELQIPVNNIWALWPYSYALESAWSLAALVSFMENYTAVEAFFYDCSVPIEMIAYLLIIYQVSSGRAWNKQTGQQLTRSLQFNHDGGHTTQTTELETAVSASQAYTSASTVNGPSPQAPLAI
ncbi:hypothetical protein P691DRAFT_681370, partial [Macrolepiota fuliginosa MF-IS2]